MQSSHTLVGRLGFLFLAVHLGTSCSKPDLAEQKNQTSYALGYEVGTSFTKNEIAIDETAFSLGLKDALMKKSSRLDEATLAEASRRAQVKAQEKYEELQGAAAQKLKETEAFLAENKAKKEVKTTPSGLQYEVITQGKGPRPKEGQIVKIHYEGTLLDGTTFDSSRARKQVAEFPVDQVFKGWSEGLKLMPSGSRWKLWIPPQLAYGERGAPPNIPPNALVVLDVELLEIAEAPKQ